MSGCYDDIPVSTNRIFIERGKTFGDNSAGVGGERGTIPW